MIALVFIIWLTATGVVGLSAIRPIAALHLQDKEHAKRLFLGLICLIVLVGGYAAPRPHETWWGDILLIGALVFAIAVLWLTTSQGRWNSFFASDVAWYWKTVLCLICLFGLMSAGIQTDEKETAMYAQKHPQEYLVVQTQQHAANAQAQADATKAQAEAQKKAAATAEQEKMQPLILGLTAINGFAPKKCGDHSDVCLSVLNTFAQTLFNLGNLSLTAEEKTRVQDLRTRVIKAQRIALPLIRQGFGKIIGQKLWEYNIEVTVKGPSNRTLALVGGMFASNANIKQTQESLHAMLVKLRYTKTTYHWIEDAEGYSYTTNPLYNDDTILAWDDEANVIEVKAP